MNFKKIWNIMKPGIKTKDLINTGYDKGYLDIARMDLIAGWHANGETEKSKVQIIIDEKYEFKLWCSEHRKDLEKIGINNGIAGFSSKKHASIVEKILRKKGVAKIEVTDENENPLKNTPAYLYNTKAKLGTANIFTPTFFTTDGSHFFHGGAERYIIDLCEILNSLNIRPTIYQASQNGAWKKYYKDICVEGVPVASMNMKDMSKEFFNASRDSDINIYSPFTLAVTNIREPSLGISHGVYWDAPGGEYLCGDNQEVIDSGILHCKKIVSVDTNTINFIRSTNANFTSKMDYIPNYVGKEFFTEKEYSNSIRENQNQDPECINICYPRRIYNARGFALIEKVIPRILSKYKNVKFMLVGGASDEDIRRVEKLIKIDQQRIEWLECQPQSMPQIYKCVDISLIPTIHSEGTSLSALEAMASGNAVIATNVGGLTDIVIDGYNGLLINPDENELNEALEKLIENQQLRFDIAKRAKFMAEFFSKEKWKNSWLQVINSLCTTNNNNYTINNQALTTFVFLRTDGISWSVMRQRPHHIARALAKLGHIVYFCSDKTESIEEIEDASQYGIIIISPGMEIHANNAIFYTCYAFHAEYLNKKVNGIYLDKFKRGSVDPFEKIHVDSSEFWFDLLDDVSIHSDDNYIEATKHCCNISAIVSYSSKPLENWLDKIGKAQGIYIPNSVFSEDFDLALNFKNRKYISLDISSDRDFVLDTIPLEILQEKLCVVYYGAIAEWLDFDALNALLDDRDILLLTAGPITDTARKNFEKLIANNNVYHFGTLKYSQLPQLLKYCDIGLVPFTKCQMTNAVLPLKLFEYLSSGIPTLTTQLDAIMTLDHKLFEDNALYFYTDTNEFINQIRKIKNTLSKCKVTSSLCKTNWNDSIYPLLQKIKPLSQVKILSLLKNSSGTGTLKEEFFNEIHIESIDLDVFKFASFEIRKASTYTEDLIRISIKASTDAVFYGNIPKFRITNTHDTFVDLSDLANGVNFSITDVNSNIRLTLETQGAGSSGKITLSIKVI